MADYERPQAPTATPVVRRTRAVALLAILVGISGGVEVLAGALILSGSSALTFLVSDFQLLGQPLGGLGPVVVGLGLATVGLAVGLWRLRAWALGLGVALSVLAVVLGGIAHDYGSFTFIRGIVVLVYLLRVRGDFLPPTPLASPLPSAAGPTSRDVE